MNYMKRNVSIHQFIFTYGNEQNWLYVWVNCSKSE